MQTVSAEEGQPVDPLFLITSQFGIDRYVQWIILDILDVHQLFHELSVDCKLKRKPYALKTTMKFKSLITSISFLIQKIVNVTSN